MTPRPAIADNADPAEGVLAPTRAEHVSEPLEDLCQAESEAVTAPTGALGRLASRLKPDVAGTVITQVATFGIQALHGIVLARLLSPVGRGEYGTIVLFSQTLMYAGLLGVLFSVAKRAGQDSAGRAQLARASLRGGLITGGICWVTVSLLACFALPASKQYLSPLCIFAGLLLVTEHPRLALLAVDHGSGDFRRYNLNRLLSASAFLVMLGVVWAAGMVSVESVTLVFVLTPAIALAALVRSHREMRGAGPPDPAPTVLIREGLPYAPSYFAAQLLGRVALLLTLWLLPLAEQGHYTVALAVTGLLAIVPNALALFSFNRGAAAASASQAAAAGAGGLVRAGLAVLLIQAVSSLGLALLFTPWIGFIFGAEYEPVIPIVLILIPGYALDGAAHVAEGYLRGCGRPLSTLQARVIGSVVLVGSAFALLPSAGSYAIPIASSVGHAASAVIILITAMRHCLAPDNDSSDDEPSDEPGEGANATPS